MIGNNRNLHVPIISYHFFEFLLGVLSTRFLITGFSYYRDPGCSFTALLRQSNTVLEVYRDRVIIEFYSSTETGENDKN